MKKRKDFVFGFTAALIAAALVFLTEQIIKPSYAVKSAIKLICFLNAITLYCAFCKKKFSDVIRLRRIMNIKTILVYMLVFFIGTAAAFILAYGRLDLENIRQSLISKENLTKENCIFVFLYIIFCNSFLEESFFRGFVTGLFENKRLGSVISAVMFSLYHIGIFITWFDPLIFALCIVGLTAVGLFLQWLSDKYDSILASYITHACANVAINTVGVLLIFEII